MIGLIHYNLPGTLEEFLDFAAESGFECVEIQPGDIYVGDEDATLAQARTVRAMMDARGLKTSAFAAGNDFFVKSPAEMDQQVEKVKLACKVAVILGTNVLRVDGGWDKDGVAEADHMDLIVEGFTRTVDFAEEAGLVMALDNHGTATNDADLQIGIFKRVGSKVMGANLDTMNYRWFGHDLPTLRGFYERIAPWVKHCHFKDGRGSRGEYVGTVLGEGEIELEYALECLKDVGYQGPWLVEYEGSDNHREGYRKGLAWLKARV